VRVRLLLVVATAVCVALSSACGSSNGSTPGATGPSTEGTGAATPAQTSDGSGQFDCPPTAMIDSVLGGQRKDPTTKGDEASYTCAYASTSTNAAQAVLAEADVAFTSNATPDLYKQVRQISAMTGATVTDVTGFQDEAYTEVHTVGDVTLNAMAARKGSRLIQVTSSASIAREKALLGALFR
jgi:hypothetical protein